MEKLTIYYDDLQEGMWFKKLHPYLTNAKLSPITGSENINPEIKRALKYDRADIILTHENIPILVVERTIEVPSGHNVGQRYARIAGAAEENIPSVYIFPYVAVKHGGETAGPRYTNLRLFRSFENLMALTGSVVTTINWPVDDDCEVLTTPAKDIRFIEYLNLFFEYYSQNGLDNIHSYIQDSDFQQEQYDEIEIFSQSVKRRSTYDTPPPSVSIMSTSDFKLNYNIKVNNPSIGNIIVYDIGMNYLRSDPYTGTAMLYDYLYKDHSSDLLVLNFKQLQKSQWTTKAKTGRKDIKLYKHVADGILFKDGFIEKKEL